MKAASSPSRALKAPVRWLKAYWDEDDEWYYFEADDDGWVLRQIVLRGPTRTPTTAASLAELPDAAVAGIDAARRYDARYGLTSEAPISDLDEGFDPIEIDRAEFETEWTAARPYLEERSPSNEC